ncbi:MAG: beta-glucosidase [Planctomycetota bacterium]|nr:MAG: beta-glucosidase [Planctomycetota bacterium]
MLFPRDFTWGVASSAYQIEGATKEHGRSPSVWDTFDAVPGNVFENHTGAVACDHVHHLEEDLDLIAGLGVGAYRFSISWPRVMPAGTDAPSNAGLDFYDRLVDGLIARGIQPFATLYHWDHPQSLQDRGGWLNRDIADWFAEYAAAVVDRLSDRVTRWMTLNEPQIFIGHGLIDGTHAPGLTLSRKESLQAAHHALLAHGKAVDAIRAHARKTPSIGWAPVGDTVFPADDRPESIEAARALTFTIRNPQGNWAFCNTWFADPIIFGNYPEDGLQLFGQDAPLIEAGDMEQISRPIDFYGLNIYSGVPAHMTNRGPEVLDFAPGNPRTQFNWPVTPQALYWGPRFIYERYKTPLYITENGLASMDWVHRDNSVPDPGRIDYTARYLAELRRAIDDGVDVRGYFHWSILDNFEWAEGYRMRFGLIHVDYQTLKRTPKHSYYWYRQVIASNGSELEALEPTA